MANIKSAIKRARQNTKRRQHNAGMRSMLRTYVKKALLAIQSNDVDAAKAAFIKAQSILDQAVNKGLIHKNKASRHKSRINAKLKAMAA